MQPLICSDPFPWGGTLREEETSPVGTGARGRRGGEAPRGAEPMNTPAGGAPKLG